MALCWQHDHGRWSRQAPNPNPEIVDVVFLSQVRSALGFGHVEDRLVVGEMESGTMKRFWDSRLSSHFRDYDRRNNGVGYFRWSDDEPSARQKDNHKRAILLEDGRGYKVVIPKSGHQSFPNLEFDKVANEVREANDWPIDNEMMGRIYEGVIKILHHDKPRCCKTEKLKQISQSRRAATNPVMGVQSPARFAQTAKRPLAVDSDTEFDRKPTSYMPSVNSGAQRNSYRPVYGQASGGATSPDLGPAASSTPRLLKELASQVVVQAHLETPRSGKDLNPV
ncbi:MAG: hypothetical protein ASARMPRED_006906 [Alectoria sarmentosa]|nr:MAG: hypothetical protein ASARMPRED_006906 [Alectoria sarmentosa]